MLWWNWSIHLILIQRRTKARCCSGQTYFQILFSNEEPSLARKDRHLWHLNESGMSGLKTKNSMFWKSWVCVWLTSGKNRYFSKIWSSKHWRFGRFHLMGRKKGRLSGTLAPGGTDPSYTTAFKSYVHVHIHPGDARCLCMENLVWIQVSFTHARPQTDHRLV